MTPKDTSEPQSSPVNRIYSYEPRILGVDAEAEFDDSGCSPYDVGDVVFVKPVDVRCDVQYKTGVVTGVVSEHAVEVDGVSRHVRDLRSVWTPNDGAAPSSSETPGGDEDEDEDREVPDLEAAVPRRSSRTIFPPDRYGAKCWSRQ